eukprot:gnl/TRDRNA2_/TRDRNA2_176153_c14_seq3.p1 gnl/TRDRNA2_/TRDRNA2_176153_c14~~gnl/TRDRNA2_/TRDRNA2_176153_c14_seq3.p1  ORF type:complete len:259 (+),score=20.80 gnl/TRDRNA2_/TRDRNA2_176153_c14_seq3:119-895(+)
MGVPHSAGPISRVGSPVQSEPSTSPAVMCPIDTGLTHSRCQGQPVHAWGDLGSTDDAKSCADKCLQKPGCQFAVYKESVNGKKHGQCSEFGDCQRFLEKQGSIFKVYARKQGASCTPLQRDLRRAVALDGRCIHPPTADTESFECDCFDAMNRRCQEITQVHGLSGFTVENCLQAMMCDHARVCTEWKNEHCSDDIFKSNLIPLLRSFEQTARAGKKATTVALNASRSSLYRMMQARSRRNLLMAQGLEQTLGKKECQ